MLDVSPQVAIILYEAYAKLSGRTGRDHYTMYDYLRVVMSKIAPVDAFYVGLIHGGNRVRFPYSFDGDTHDDTDSHTIGKSGLTAWLLENKTTYRYAMDQGELLNKGISFGDVRKVSADAVTVPLIRSGFDASQEVFGMLSMQTYRSNVYSNDAVSALEWLSRIVSRVLLREREDRDALTDLRVNIGEKSSDAFLTSDQVVEYLIEQVGEVRRQAEKSLADGEARLDAYQEVLSSIVLDCRKIQADLIEMTLSADDRPTQRFLSLTPAEQTVAVLAAEGLSNQKIADRLRPTSIHTVKSHLKSIALKYGMGQRSQIAADVNAHLGRPTDPNGP